jgi:hypothetical protein
MGFGISGPPPCSVPNVQDDDLIGSVAHCIENQKWVSHNRHHAHPFLVGEMTDQRNFPDQRTQPLDAIDNGHRGGSVTLVDVREKSRLAHEVRSRSSVPSCAVASKRSCDLILTRQFALSHLPKPAPHRCSFFIIEMVDTKVLFLNVDHGLHELFLCLFRPSSDVLQENFKVRFVMVASVSRFARGQHQTRVSVTQLSRAV